MPAIMAKLCNTSPVAGLIFCSRPNFELLWEIQRFPSWSNAAPWERAAILTLNNSSGSRPVLKCTGSIL